MWWEEHARQGGEQLKGPGVELHCEGPGAAGARGFSTVMGRLLGGAPRMHQHHEGSGFYLK